jgi:hypothetical protein
MNSTINLSELVARYDLDTEALAKVLFPTVKYPKHALARILKGEAFLDTVQLGALATYIGVPTAELLSDDFWKGCTEDGCLIFTKGEYKVKLNYNNVFLSIYRNGELCLQEICSAPSMSISEFTQYLDKQIKNLENGSN